MRKHRLTACAMLAFFLSSCAGAHVEERASLWISETKITLSVGEEFLLTARLEGTEREPVYSWRTSDGAIARVAGGLVIGVSVGEACISVQTRENTATCKVVVTDEKGG